MRLGRLLEQHWHLRHIWILGDLLLILLLQLTALVPPPAEDCDGHEESKGDERDYEQISGHQSGTRWLPC